MKNTTEKPAKQKKMRGPKRVEFIPESMRGVAGVEEVTTVKQLVRLQEFVAMAPGERLPFVRLGSSVPAQNGRRELSPSATYAVDVEGRVSVIRKSGDPRRAHIWIQNSLRPWNLCRDSRFGVSHTVSATRVRVVTLAALDAEGGSVPTWLSEESPECLRPDGKITRVWACHARLQSGCASRVFIVEGVGNWWEQREIADLDSIRETKNEIISAEGSMLWVAQDRVIEFSPYGYADSELLPKVGELCVDPISYLRTRLAEQLRVRVCAAVSVAGDDYDESIVCDRVKRAVASIDISTAGLADVDALRTELIAMLITRREVCA